MWHSNLRVLLVTYTTCKVRPETWAEGSLPFILDWREHREAAGVDSKDHREMGPEEIQGQA